MNTNQNIPNEAYERLDWLRRKENERVRLRCTWQSGASFRKRLGGVWGPLTGTYMELLSTRSMKSFASLANHRPRKRQPVRCLWHKLFTKI